MPSTCPCPRFNKHIDMQLYKGTTLSLPDFSVLFGIDRWTAMSEVTCITNRAQSQGRFSQRVVLFCIHPLHKDIYRKICSLPTDFLGPAAGPLCRQYSLRKIVLGLTRPVAGYRGALAFLIPRHYY